MDIALAGSFAPDDDRRRAALSLTLAVLAGGATQALFWRTGFGLNFWLWDLFVVGGTVLLLRSGRRTLTPTAWGAVGASVLLGFSIVRFESIWTLAIAVPATLAILAVLPLLVRDRITLAELGSLPVEAVRSLKRAPGAAAEAARLPAIAVGGPGRGVLRGVTRGLALGLPTAGLFTLLLGTDDDFTDTLARVRASLGDATLFALWSVATAAGYLVTHALHRRGSARAHALPTDDAPYRAVERGWLPAPAPPTGRVSVVTWATVIGQVTLVFAVFVGANLRHLFGGTALVRATGTLTYARYLYSGFAELLVATVLSVCLVLAGHALLRPRGVASGAVPGGKVLTALEGSLLVLTGITVASCWQRLRIYEDAYGATHLRLGVAFVELSILGVLALTLAKVVRRSWRGHAGALLAFAAALAVAASGFNADAYVARTNLDRAAAGKSLDVPYLLSLSRDVASLLDHPVVKSDPSLGGRFAQRMCDMGGEPRRDLRSFRGLGPRCGTGGW